MGESVAESGDQPARPRPRGKACWADRIDEILDTAARVFAERGYQATEMQQIADALQIAKGTLYLYFASKEELFLKAVSRGMQRLSCSVRESSAEASDSVDVMVRAIRAYFAFYREHPQYVELLIQERAHFRDSRKSTYFAHTETTADPWKARYSELIAAGRLRDMPVDRILGVINDLVYGTMLSSYISGRNIPLEEQVQDTIDVFFNGILSDRERTDRHTDSGREPHVANQAPESKAQVKR